MPLIRTKRVRSLAIYLPNGAIFTGESYEACREKANKELLFNKEKLLAGAKMGFINEKDEFQEGNYNG